MNFVVFLRGECSQQTCCVIHGMVLVEFPEWPTTYLSIYCFLNPVKAMKYFLVKLVENYSSP